MIRAWLTALLTRLREWSPARKLMLGGSLAAVMIALVVISFLSARPNYTLLYGGLSESDQIAIIRILENNAIDYNQSNDGSTITVPSAQVSEVRLLLADQGLPSTTSSVGYELFDNDTAFGRSNFVQEVTHLRALEGELARTIASLEPIARARVHLVLPRRELFSREKQPPSASIIVALVGNNSTLAPRQVQSIRHLTAAAVPELPIDAISIVDERGNLLAKPIEEGELFAGATPASIRSAYETRLTQELEQLVSQIVGFGKVRVQVRAEMDFSQTVINEENFDPDGQVLRSQEEITESSERTNIQDTRVTIENNLPEGIAQADELPTEIERSARTEERRNFDISRTSTNRIVAPGQLDRLSVAVLVDGIYTTAADGAQTYQPRTPEELSQIERLVKSAIGFDDTVRRDTVEIVNLRFAEEINMITDATPSIYGIPIDALRSFAEILVLGVVLIVIILAVVRPLLASIIRSSEEEVESRLLADQRLSPAGNLLERYEEAAQKATEPEPGEAMIDLDRINSRVRRSLANRIAEVVRRHPNESSSLMKDWLEQSD